MDSGNISGHQHHTDSQCHEQQSCTHYRIYIADDLVDSTVLGELFKSCVDIVKELCVALLDSNSVVLYRILSLKDLTQEEKAELAKMCGFEVKNGRIITKNVLTA